MEGVQEMEVGNNIENHLTSAAAFVDGGIQDPCDDACSICLEEFSDSNPSSITTCKHEFHLQCVLEWCQRSSQCPMCWQPVSLKDPDSQELLEAVERERNFRIAPPRNTTIFHHPTLGDFELQHLPAGVNEAELEERIIQHLAAAAAMGRAHHVRRRESQRGRSSAHGRPHYLMFSNHPSEHHPGLVSSVGGNFEPAAVSESTTRIHSGRDEPSLQIPRLPFVQTSENSSSTSGSNFIPTNNQGSSFMNREHHPGLVSSVGGNFEPAAVSESTPSTRIHSGRDEPSPQIPRLPFVQTSENSSSTSGSNFIPTNNQGSSFMNRTQPSPDRAGPSDLQSFSDALKSKFSAMSTRYKESFSKSTRGWKERLFTRNSPATDSGSEARREVNEGIASVSRMMERLETGDRNTGQVSVSDILGNDSSVEQGNGNGEQARGESSVVNGSNTQTFAASSTSC